MAEVGDGVEGGGEDGELPRRCVRGSAEPVWGYPVFGLSAARVGATIYTPEHRRLTALLRSLREEAGLTQYEVAERLGRPQSFVSKYESGQRRLDLVELRWIARALRVPLAELVARFETSVARMPRRQGTDRRRSD